jgi:hypothetical protein
VLTHWYIGSHIRQANSEEGGVLENRCDYTFNLSFVVRELDLKEWIIEEVASVHEYSVALTFSHGDYFFRLGLNPLRLFFVSLLPSNVC